MTSIYEMDTWRGRDDLNQRAIKAAKNYSGRKYTVSIGQWGTVTFLVFADSKEQAKKLALTEYSNGSYNADNPEKVMTRDVTNSKKYN